MVILQTIKNLHAPTSNNDAFNKAFCETTYRKKSDDNQLVILGSGNRWEAEDKTIYDLIRTQYDDEAVASRQRKDFSDKKYVDSKTFTIDASKGLDMKGNKVIHVADPTSATDGGKKQAIIWKPMVQEQWLVIWIWTAKVELMSKRHRHKKRHAADVNFINTTINNNSTPMSIHYQKYVTDRLN